MSDDFNADMLDLARGARGMTQAEVAKAAGVSQAMLSKVENRLLLPTRELAEHLASALGFPVGFFYQLERAHGFPHFHHRKRAALGAKSLAKIHAILNIRSQHIRRLMKSYEVPHERQIPLIDLDEKRCSPADAARMVREYWLLPRGPVENLSCAIEDAGGVIIVTDFGTAQLDGISFRSPGLPPIFVMNSEVPGDRFRFSLAHELGHMVMHALPGEDARMEADADEFAAALLMPAAEVRSHLMPPSIEKFSRAKPYWKASIKSMIRRAKDLRLISADDYRRMSIAYSKVGYSRGEPFALERENPTRLGKMISFHMAKLGYSVSDLAELLLLEEDDFRKLYLPRFRLELVSSR